MAPANRTYNIILGRAWPLDRQPSGGAGPPLHLGAECRHRSAHPLRRQLPHPRSGGDLLGLQEEDYVVSDPVLLIEILSPGNRAETWANVWAYATIPGVQEIPVLHSRRILAELLRRNDAGEWPDRPTVIEDGMLELHSIDFAVPLTAAYCGTRLDREAAV